MQRFTTLALILAAASTANADDVVDRYRDNFDWYPKFTETLLYDPTHNGTAAQSAEDCAKDIERAKVEGVAADAVFKIWINSKPEDLTLAGVATKVCAPFERAFRITELGKVFSSNMRTLRTFVGTDLTELNPDLASGFESQAKECFAAADRSDKLGYGDVDLGDVHFDEMREKVCEPMAKLAKTWAADVKKAYDADQAERAAPYKAVGITGDKLQFCIDNSRHKVRGLRGIDLTPAQMKKASVMFVLWADSSSGVYSLQRYAFKGMRFVSQSEQQFALTPGPGAYR